MSTSQNHSALGRSRIACIDILSITVEIHLQPRRVAREDARLVRAAERARLNREIAREQASVRARLLMGG